MSQPLGAGDPVQLKSGGPVMTITSIEDDRATVTWFDAKKEARYGTYPLVTLIRYEVSSVGVLVGRTGRSSRTRGL